MKKLITLITAFLTSCTYSITNSMVHTQGTASQVGEDSSTQSASPKTDANVDIPIQSANSGQQASIAQSAPTTQANSPTSQSPSAPAIK